MMGATMFRALLGQSHTEPGIFGLNFQVGIMIWSQSNAEGTTAGVAPPTSPINYQAAINGAFINTSADNFETLNYPTNNAGALHGAELSLGYDLFQNYGVPIFYSKVAVGGSPLYNQAGHTNFSPLATGGDNLYTTLRDKFLALQTRCALYGKTPYIISIFIGGEADAVPAQSANIRANYEAVIHQLSVDGVTVNHHIINQLSVNITGSILTADRNIVRAQMEGYCLAHPNATFFDMDSYAVGADNIHFTSASQIQIGLDLATVIKDEIFGGTIEAVTGGYSTEAVKALKQFRSDFPTGWKNAIAAFIDGCVTDGNYSKLVSVQVRAMNTAANAFVDLLARHPGINRGGTFTAKVGVAYNGSSTYGEAGFNAAKDGDTRFTLNNALVGWYIVTNSNSTGTHYLGGINNSGRIGIVETIGTQITYRMNSSAAGAYATENKFANGHLYSLRRTLSTGAGATGYIKDATVLDGDNFASTSMPYGSIFEGAENASGTAGSHSAITLGLFYAADPTSFDFTAFSGRVNTLLSTISGL